MISIQLRSRVAGSIVEAMLGKHVDESHYDLLVTGPARIYKPDGTILCCLVKDALDEALVDGALPHLQAFKELGGSDNRGKYAGFASGKRLKADGTLSSTSGSIDPETGERAVVLSHIAGYFDRYPRLPFCRETAFTAHEAARWGALANGLVRRVGQVFADSAPERYTVQANIAAQTSKDFVIPSTPFTTLTINNTVRAACHYDAGDLKAGLGCLTAHRSGRFRGFHLVFPEWRCAVDVGHRDVLLFNSHDMHANTAMEKIDAWAERVSVVYYYREKMLECGTATEERKRAAAMRGALE